MSTGGCEIRARPRHLLLVCALFALCGCSSGRYTYDEQVQSQDNASSLAASIGSSSQPQVEKNKSAIAPASYAAPEEPVPLATGGLLSFDEAIALTLQADPKLHAGYEAVVQANGDLLTARLLPNPSLLADGLFLPVTPLTPDHPGGPPQMDVQVSWQIDWLLFGKRAAAMDSARVAVRQSEADYADLVRTRVLATATAYYDALEAKGLLDVARKDTENLTQFSAVIGQAVTNGGRPQIDLDRSRLDLLKSQQELREAEWNLAAAKAKLRALIGRADSDPNFDVSGNLDVPLNGEPPSADAAYELAQENRPDINSLRLRVSKAQADVVVARRNAFPQVTPMLGWTRQFQHVALQAPDADTLGTSVTVTLPVFDRNQGNRLKAESVAAQNSLNLESGLVELRSEIEQAVQEFRTSYRNAKAVGDDQLKTAESVLKAIREAKNLGGRPLVDLLDAEREYRDTYRTYVTNRANYWRSLYKFSAAVGKQIQPGPSPEP